MNRESTDSASRKADHNQRIRFYMVCIALMLCMLFMIAHTSHRIYLYSQPPSSVSGTLKDVHWQPRAGLEVYIDSERYLLDKDAQYSKRTFGIIMNAKLGELKSLLESKLGSECHIDYFTLNKIDSNNKQIVGLTIDDFVYVDPNIAIEDIIGYENSSRRIGIAVIALLIILIFLERKGIIR